VAEHIGLGRYGDDIDPAGFTKACSELARILSPGGNLFFSVPIGKAGTVFNVHRILDTLGVIDAFPEIEMIEFSIINSNGQYRRNVDMHTPQFDTYGCGLFHFRKKGGTEQ
jgi:hypothetical protein